MRTASADAPDLRSRSFYVLASALLAASFLHSAHLMSDLADLLIARAIAFALFALLGASILFYFLTGRIRSAAIFLIAVSYGEILAISALPPGAAAIAAPFLILAPLAAGVLLGPRAGVAALAASALAMIGLVSIAAAGVEENVALVTEADFLLIIGSSAALFSAAALDVVIIYQLSAKRALERLDQANQRIVSKTSALEASEALFAATEEACATGLWSWADEGRAQWASAGWMMRLGGDESASAGQTASWTDFLHPDDAPNVKSALAGYARNGARAPLEFRMKRKDSSILSVVALCAAKDPKIDGDARVAGVFFDVTEHRRIEERLREREAFVETVLESISDGVMAAGNDGEITLFNRAARAFFDLDAGLSLAEAQERIKGAKIFCADGAEPIETDDLPVHRVLRGEEPPPMELTLVMHDQSARTVIANASALRDSSGDQVGGVVTFHDVTDRSRQEEEIRWQRNLLELILDNVPVCIWIKDAHNRIVKMNSEAAAFFGVTREEAIGLNISALMPQGAQAHLEDDPAILESGAPRHGLISEVASTDGARKWCRIDKAPFCDPRTGAQLLLVAATDVTSLKLAQDTLARANGELDQFTRAVSHDLQEPLRKLIIFSEFLEKDFDSRDHEAVRSDMEAIKSSASRMRQMVKDLLSLSRLQESETHLDVVDPASCIDSAIANLHLTIRGNEPRYEFQRLPAVIADRTLLTQIYQNLISNALKFMPAEEAPIIEFTAEKVAGEMILGVRDNGIGVPEKHRLRIFEPLVRLHRKEEFDGTGIGLSICAKAVRRLGGRIWVDDSFPRGSHFRFTVNAADERRDAA